MHYEDPFENAILDAFDLQDLRAGRHYILNPARKSVERFNAEYLWIANIRPSFSLPFRVSSIWVKGEDSHESAGEDRLMAGIFSTFFIELGEISTDPFMSMLGKTDLSGEPNDMVLDGISYSIKIFFPGRGFKLFLDNPDTPGLRALESSLFKVGNAVASSDKAKSLMHDWKRYLKR